MLSSTSLYICAFAIAVLANSATARVKPSRSTCREPIIFQNINVARVLGHWYEYSRYDHDFEEGCDCYTSEVTPTDATSLQMLSCCQMTKISNETQTCNIGINNARIANADKTEAFFLFTRNGVDSEIWIVDTDYDNYMIIDACEHVSDDEDRELFWIMTREKTISEDVEKRIDNVLQTNHFDMSKIIRQRHGADVCKSKRPQTGLKSGLLPQ